LSGSPSDRVTRLMLEEPNSSENAGEQIVRRRSLAIIDGLLSVTQQAWRLDSNWVPELNQ